MNIDSAYTNAYTGIQKGMQGLALNASELASTKQMEGKADPTKPLVESQTNQRDVEASTKVLKAVDENMGTLLDVMA